jgi:sugar/nucleoside kinase (ribokinase family)
MTLQDAIVDTTGAGDAFIGTLLYAICHGMPPEKSLRLAAVVAAKKCTTVGARGGLPQRSSLSDMLFL